MRLLRLVVAFCVLGISLRVDATDLKILGTMAPNPGSTFPIARTNDVAGGLWEFASTAARDAAPAERLVVGQLAYVVATGFTYQLTNTVGPVWVQFAAGGVTSAIAGNGVLVSSATGNVTFSADFGTAVNKVTQGNDARLPPAPSTLGNLLYDTSSAYAALADVAVGSYLRSGGVGAAPLWSTLKLPNAATTGDVIAATSSNTLGVVSIGSAGTLLRSTGTGPAWSATTWPNSATTGDLVFASGSNAYANLAVGTANQVLVGGTAPAWGTVPNAALANSSVTINTTSPVTGGGSLSLGGSLTLACATCITGSPSATGDLLYSTSGGQAQTALADVTAGSYLRSGGSAAAPVWSTTTLPNSATTGDVLYASASNVYSNLASSTAGRLLRAGGAGTAPTWSTPVFPNAATTGDLIYASGSNTYGQLAVGTANQALIGGTTPTWGTVPNAGLTNSSITVASSVTMTGSGTVSLGGTYSPAVDVTYAFPWTGSHTWTGDATTLQSLVGVAATGGSTLKSSPIQHWLAHYWDGAASQPLTADAQLVAAATTPMSYYQLTIGTAAHRLYSTGSNTLPDGSTAAVSGSSRGAIRYNDTLTPKQFELSVNGGAYDAVVTAAASQTLTNKTISGSSNTLSNIANASLTNSTITFGSGTGTTGSGSTALGGTGSVNVTYGTGSNTATQGNDARLPPAPSTLGNLVYDTGSAYTSLADVAVGSYLRAGGVAAAPLWSTLTLPNTVTTGDILHATGSNAVGSLAIGAASKMLRSTGTLPAWSTPTWPNAATTGDLIYASGSNAYAQLAVGTANQVLLGGTVPAWGTAPNAALTNSSITIGVGTGINGGGAVSLGATSTALTVDQSFSPTWTGTHIFSGHTVTIQGVGGALAVSPGATTGTPTRSVTITTPAHTSLTASTEFTPVLEDYNTNNLELLSGTVTLQRYHRLMQPTLLGHTATATFTDASTFYIDGAPLAGSNAAITNTASALWVAAGTARFGGGVLNASGNGFITPNHQMHIFGGGSRVQPLLTAATPTLVVTSGGGGTTKTNTYAIVALDAFGGRTLQSASGTTASGPDTLDNTHFTTVNWTATNGAASYDVYRIACTSTLGNVGGTATGFLKNTTGLTYADKNGDSAVTYTLPIRNFTADFAADGVVTAGTGTAGSGTVSIATTGIVTASGTPFVAANVGNIIQVAGVNYYIVLFTSSSSITVSPAPTTAVGSTAFSIIPVGTLQSPSTSSTNLTMQFMSADGKSTIGVTNAGPQLQNTTTGTGTVIVNASGLVVMTAGSANTVNTVGVTVNRPFAPNVDAGVNNTFIDLGTSATRWRQLNVAGGIAEGSTAAPVVALDVFGTTHLQLMAVPATPTLGTITGGTSGNFTYYVIGKNQAGARISKSATVSTSVGPPGALDGTHSIIVNWTKTNGVFNWDVIRSVAAAGNSLGVVSKNNTSTSFTDAASTVVEATTDPTATAQGRSGDLTVDGTVIAGSIQGGGSAPTITKATSTQIELTGTATTVVTQGTDTDGIITLTTGTTTAVFVGGTSVIIGTITLADVNHSAAPQSIVIHPANAAAAAAMSGSTGIIFYADYTDSTSLIWKLRAVDSGAGQLTGAGTVYAFAYHVIF